MSETFSRYDAADYLDTNEDIRLYLEACIAESGDDPTAVTRALGTVARARNFSALARDVGMSRQGLYDALSDDGNPSYATVAKVLAALGLRLSVQSRASDAA